MGYYKDPDTGIYYVRARIYQPTSGRWWSVDPLGFVDGLNLYRAYFVPGGVDPLGTQCDKVFNSGTYNQGRPTIPEGPTYDVYLNESQVGYGPWLINGFYEFIGNQGIIDWYYGSGDPIYYMPGSFVNEYRQLEGVKAAESRVHDFLKPSQPFPKCKETWCSLFGGSVEILPRLSEIDMRLFVQRHYLFWRANCQSGPPSGNKKCKSPFKCTVTWVMHDLYDFEPWNPLGLLGIVNGDFYIRAQWQTSVSGFVEAKDCRCDK
ncbi:RHS repeat domain-containing protein [Planctomicrobium sp. SH664]|uniref:RHS repeat domain-containing protein n=1 Tax=Planctomicrobium sp. SH664 TaxID=3448125 RepID=UPI003F5BCFD1